MENSKELFIKAFLEAERLDNASLPNENKSEWEFSENFKRSIGGISMKDIEIFDIVEDRPISPEEFFDDETEEDIDYYIDLKIHLIIEELKKSASYKDIKETLLDSEVFFDEEFYNEIKNSSMPSEKIYDVIYNKVKSYEQNKSEDN